MICLRIFFKNIVFLLGLSGSFISYSKETVSWANDQLKKSIDVYEDRTTNQTIESIRQLNETEFTPGNIHQNFGFTTSAWWVRFKLKNVKQEHVSLFLNLSNGHIHDVRFFGGLPDDAKAVITGNHYPFSTRPLKYPDFLFPIQLKAEEERTFYLRLEKRGAELNAPLQILPGDYDYASIFNQWHLLFGSTFLYIFILFVAACIIRNRVVFYYFIYAGCLCIYMATTKSIAFSDFWPNQTWIQTNILELSKHLANIFYIVFILKFIGPQAPYSKINLFLKICIVLCALNILCRLIYSTTNIIPDTIMMRFVECTALLLPVADGCLVYLLYRSWRANRKAEVMWLLIITTGLIIPLIFLVCLHFGIIPALPLYPNLLVIMFLIEIICISIIIVYRYYELYTLEIQHLREITNLRKKAVENILLGQEEERIRISKDLHDGISLSLANMRMRLSSLENKMELLPQRKIIGEIISQLGSTSQEVRNISHNLAPLSLQHQELTIAIEELVYQIELNDSNLDIEFKYSPDINKRLSAIMKQNIYQTVKELFTNILKYAKASEIKISLIHEQNVLQLEIADNGVCYDFQQALIQGNGLGLTSIQSRATLLNGTFDAISRPEGGMVHQWSIPSLSLV